MTENERQQRMMERIQEDERLRGDLEDEAATALISWASERAGAAAADPARSDEAVEAEVQAVRQAARAAARSGENDPARLVALAEAELGKAAPRGPAPAAAPHVAATPEPTPPPIDAPALHMSEVDGPIVVQPDAPPAAPTQPTQPAPARSRDQRPAGAGDGQARRKRSRLATYLKRGRGER